MHWPPVKFRIQYKIAAFAYRHSEESLPPCLSVPLRINQRLVLFDPLMKTSQNPENQFEKLWSVLIDILGPWCLELAAC